MQPPTRVRRNRLDGERQNKTVSLPAAIVLAAMEEARKEGHNNFSTVVLQSLIAYLNRQNDVRAA